MPITLPETLPAFDVLSREGVMVMSPDRAAHQDIRPLRIALLNLMPKKIQTENQFARLIGATPLQIDLSPDPDVRTPDQEHRRRAYGGVLPPLPGGAATEKFDGLIITGAPD